MKLTHINEKHNPKMVDVGEKDITKRVAAASGKVNENAKKLLIKENAWKEEYHSKDIDEVMDIDFDLVVTVCDNAKETCPAFPKKVKTVHIGFSDPDGKEYKEFEKLADEIKGSLLNKVKEIIG